MRPPARLLLAIPAASAPVTARPSQFHGAELTYFYQGLSPSEKSQGRICRPCLPVSLAPALAGCLTRPMLLTASAVFDRTPTCVQSPGPLHSFTMSLL